MKNKFTLMVLTLVLVLSNGLPGETADELTNGIDPEALIERILMVEKKQRDAIEDLVFDAEYVEGEEKDGEFREKVRFTKKIFVKYLADTAFFHEEYLEYYKDGELQSDKDRDKEAGKRIENKRKRKTKDVSFSMLEPFSPDERQYYDISYEGIVDDLIEGHVCHHFRVAAHEEISEHINGDFYFEAESFNMVRVDFSPAKLVKKTMFKLNEMDMSIVYGPTEDDFWLPRQFAIAGKGKAMFFIGVKFAGTEYYRNPVINGGVDDKIFEEENGN